VCVVDSDVVVLGEQPRELVEQVYQGLLVAALRQLLTDGSLRDGVDVTLPRVFQQRLGYHFNRLL